MADFASSLPVRTETAGDLEIKIVDSLITSQKLKVNVDGSIDVNATMTATNLDIRDLVFATDKVDVSGSSVELGATTLAALENITVTATDLDIRDLTFASDKVDASGSVVALDATTLAALETVNVKVLASGVGAPIHDFNTVASIAGGATSTHSYTSTGNFYLKQIHVSSSSRMKIIIKINAVTKYTMFTTETNQNADLLLNLPILATIGQVVTIERTNKGLAATDVYSTISGYNE